MSGAKTTFRAVIRGSATLLLGAWAAVQGAGVSGTVKDRVTGQAISGAKVTVNEVGTNKLAGSCVTDAAGHYLLSVPATGNYTLVVSMAGYGDLKEPSVIALTKEAPDHTSDLSMTREGPFKELAPTNPDALSWETGARKSYLIPALEIPTFLFLLNQYDRHASPNLMEDGKKVYGTNVATTWDHMVHGPWVVDKDAFAMNQFSHPYSGTIYHGFARSAGLGYWDALLYDQMGSFLWETGGETTKPSYNDQITTGLGGSFFGEVLFRMANLMLEGDGRDPGFWHKLGATMLSPAMGVNRFVFGDRFKPVFPSNNPSLRWRLQLGGSLSSNFTQNGVASTNSHNETTFAFALDYGLPGKPGYTYDRPFDYFDFEVRSLGNRLNPVDSIMIRGLLYGTEYAMGDTYQGIWGLYGGYDYISPYIFRVSSTSVSLGTTFQWQFSRNMALQGSLLGGFGYAAAGNVTQVGERDYHFGVAPQGLAALRCIMGNRAMVDLTGRRYYITGMGGSDPGGREAIDRLNVGITVRVYDRHALGFQYIASSRNAHYPDRPDSRQTVGTFAVVYNLLGYAGFGASK
jgi:hypothetical protein